MDAHTKKAIWILKRTCCKGRDIEDHMAAMQRRRLPANRLQYARDVAAARRQVLVRGMIETSFPATRIRDIILEEVATLPARQQLRFAREIYARSAGAA